MGTGRAIPEGYKTVGELAKQMGVTVRTLQYYDRENLLKPSAESEGGRRLYTDRDMIKLDQILALKSVGFSLAEIKNHLLPLDTPAEVATALAARAADMEEQIRLLSDALADLRALREEVLQMQTVDFKRYAAILYSHRMKNEQYRLIKYLDDATLEYCRTAFDRESAVAIIETYRRLRERAVGYPTARVAPDSEEGKRFAEEFWQMLEKFTGGAHSLLPKLMKVGLLAGRESRGISAEEDAAQEAADRFIGQALDAYLQGLGIDPFGVHRDGKDNSSQEETK